MKSITPAVRPLPYFVLTFVLSWLIWIPLALSHFGLGPFRISEEISSVVRLLGVLMPATAAILLTAGTTGSVGVRELLGRVVIWRVGWKWWGTAVLVQPALLAITALFYNGLAGVPPITLLPQGSAAALVINVFFLLLATLGEEIGWRGLALPTLQAQQSAFKASLILAVVWASWHIPFWLLLDTFDQYGLPYLALNYLLVFPMTFYITWFFNHGRSSVLLAVAFHLSFNIVNTAILPVTTNLSAFVLLIAVEWLITLRILPHLAPATKLRGRSETYPYGSGAIPPCSEIKSPIQAEK